MFASLSFASILLIIILAFYFRKALQALGETTPKIVIRSVNHLDDIVTTNVLENEVELKTRSLDAYEALKDLGDININAMYEQLHPTKKPARKTTTVTA